jgi:hypothetical protein
MAGGEGFKHRKLVIDPTEAQTVRLIYRRYMELGSVRELRDELDTKVIRSKVRTHQDGSKAGGCRFGRGALYALLSNPIYIGEISHKSARYPGQHQAILDRESWDAVQQRLKDHHNGGPGPVRKVLASPLMGKLFDEEGGRISPSHALKDGRRYRYYVSRSLVTGPAKDTDRGWRLPASQIETIVALEAAKMLGDRGAIATVLEQAGLAAGQVPAAFAAAQDYCQRLRSEAECSESLASLIRRVELRPDQIAITLSLTPLIATIEGAAFSSDELTITHEVPLRIKRRGVEMRLVIEGERATPAKADPTLLKEINRAHRCFDALLTGQASIA